MNNDTFNMSGDFTGAILNIKSVLKNVTQNIDSFQNAQHDEKAKLKHLVENLNELLQNVPSNKTEVITEYLKILTDNAKKDNPNKSMIKITGNGLLEAAKSVSNIIPAIIPVTNQIVDYVLNIVNRGA